MAERRSEDEKAERAIRERVPGLEEKLCKGPCNLTEALGISLSLDGASLFKTPFRIFRPVEPVTNLLNDRRVNITKDADLLWRWGHGEYSQWLSAPFPKQNGK